VNGSVVLDGEIINLDADGRPQFYETLLRRGDQTLYVFDTLWLDGKDLRRLPLIDRKRIMQVVVAYHSRILLRSARRVEFGSSAARIEGIAAKWRHGAYGDGGSRSATRTIPSTMGGMNYSGSATQRHNALPGPSSNALHLNVAPRSKP
jgi:bifunctional non-homologous end joining protein LigD